MRPPNFDIQTTIDQASTGPGVYLMQDSKGSIIYIGKAKNLKKRLTAYYTNARSKDIKTDILIDKIADIRTIITHTEKEALILESNLIKQHKPRYNVILKDDKRYPSLRLDPDESYPRFTVVRKIGEDNALYFGPFASAQAVRETLKTINKTFKLRKCRASEFKTRTRPCLHCQLAGCLAPCCLDVDPNLYREQVGEAILFLKGRTFDLVRKIRTEMEQAAAAQQFERAARLRDKMFSLERTIEKQIAVTTDFKDRDVFAIVSSAEVRLISLFIIRGGFLTGSRHFDFEETVSTDEEALGAFIRQYYDQSHFLPDEILVSIDLSDRLLIEDWLRHNNPKAVAILHPKRGTRKKLIAMAMRNARNELHHRILARTTETELISRLQTRLQLTHLPLRIECFDNSNIAGTEPVASMVVFEEGRANKAAYRKYRLRWLDEPDDYAYLLEVLTRRFGKDQNSRPFPNLLMVDGGKGQLNIAAAVMAELKLEGKFDLVAIAKKNEKKGENQDKVFIIGRANPINFGKERDLLFFLQRIRDEAHRFAISYHRKRRSQASIRSALDRIPGIGKARKAVLLKHFGGIKKIREAKLEELSELPGFSRKVAEDILKTLAD
jgi:excinuclease ABC subunit C